MLRLTDVVKTHRIGDSTVTALDKISVEFGPGEFTAIEGPSGAGKSTLLHMLGAMDTPDSGTIILEDRDVTGMDEVEQARFRRDGIGFVFQFFNLLPAMTAWENVAMPALLGGTPLRAAKPRALELLARVGLAERAEHRPAEVSGGQMQRVAVARALMMDPPIVLADEPSGNLDSRSGAEIISLLADLAHDEDRRRTVIMVTHDRDAAAVADRVVTIADGAVIDDSADRDIPRTKGGV